MQLIDYLKQQGRGSGKRLADAVGCKEPSVSDWANGKRSVPYGRAIQIERITQGSVTRRDLCPDWADHWPELATQPATVTN